MMVVTVPTPMVEIIDDVRTDWVREYRRRHAAADQWANGLGQVSHSIATQERVFRMAEQLQRRGVDRTDLFTALEEADRRIALSGDPHSAAEAGHGAISTLVQLAPESVVLCVDEDASKLQMLGYEPAGYAWVMCELSMRADAERRSQWRLCGPRAFSTPTAIGLARL